MKIVAAVLALACPLYAQAVPVYVDYEGSISSVLRFGCRCDFARLPAADREFVDYSVGDPVKGRFVIETDLAPGDDLAFDPTMGRYGGALQVSDFILGGGPSSTHPPFSDEILVSDRQDGRTQRYALDHYWDIAQGITGLNLDVITKRSDFVHGDGIVQSFDAVPDHKTPRLTGLLQTVLEGAHGMYGVVAHVALDRFTVTPGSCHR